MIKVFITNLAKYNGGYLIGDWVTLPATPEDLDETIEEILGGDEEYFITDYETDLSIDIGEYTNVYELNELAEALDGLGEHDLNKVKAIVEWGVYGELEEAIDNIDNFTLNEDILSESDLAWYVLDEVYTDIPDNIKNYIDSERFGRDLAMDGFISEYGYIEEC